MSSFLLPFGSFREVTVAERVAEKIEPFYSLLGVSTQYNTVKLGMVVAVAFYSLLGVSGSCAI